MRAHERFIRRFTASVIGTLAVGFAGAVVSRIALADPSPTFREAVAATVRPFQFGLPLVEVSWWYLGALIVGLLGYALVASWGFVLLVVALAFGGALTLNPLLLTILYSVARTWNHFVSREPHFADPPPEWRQMLFAGTLAFIVFGPFLASHSPAAYLERLRAASIAPAQPATITARSARPPAMDEAATAAILQTTRAIAVTLKAQRARGAIASYPMSERLTPVVDIQALFPSVSQELIGQMPTEAQLTYWSNGSSFAFAAVLPTPFNYPRQLALEVPEGSVVVRAENDVDDDLDFDGLSDNVEVERWKTSPVLADTDGDSYPDGSEVGYGFDPLQPPASR